MTFLDTLIALMSGATSVAYWLNGDYATAFFAFATTFYAIDGIGVRRNWWPA